MNVELIKKALYQMQRIRYIEESIAAKYHEGKMRCPVHLSIGQEAVSVGVSMALGKNDLAVSGHRAHAHYLSKGGDLKAMIAEIYGKKAGCSSGKGGSMHLIDESVGFMGSTAIVGGTIPIGVGLAYGAMIKKSDQIICIFLGEAVLETGVFFESLNFAVLKNLPVLFICENNLYSVYSSLEVRQSGKRSISDLVKGFGIQAFSANGNDFESVFNLAQKSISSIRLGHGPAFIEFSTYRWREHCGPDYDNHIGYRSEKEFLKWKERDPINGALKILTNNSLITNIEIERMNAEITEEIITAFKFAEDSMPPEQYEAWTDLYGAK